MYSIKKEDLEKLEELASLQGQVEEVRLQEKLGKQNFHEKKKKINELFTDTIKNTSENLTKTVTETSFKNNQEMENSNEKVLELKKDKGMIAPCLASFLVNLFKPENIIQFMLLKILILLD